MSEKDKHNRLLKSEILRKKKDFRHIFTIAKSMSNSNFTLRYLECPKRAVAFLVSHSVASKAVTRNRIKRHLRETYRTNKDKFLENYTYVFLARSGTVNLNLDKIREETLSLAEKVKQQTLN